MKIDCYLSLTCNSEDALKENVLKALDLEDLKADLNFYRIDEMEANRLGLRGSPAVLINDEDIQPVDMPRFS